MKDDAAGIPQDIYDDAEALFDFNQLHHQLRPCPVAIGLGSHDLGVANITAALFHQGLFPLVVFTGGNAPTTRDRFPGGEAVHYRTRAIELGVPPEAILLEPRATNTRENFEFSRQLLANHGINPPSALVTSRPYQQRRAYATCRQAWPTLEVLCASERRTLASYIATIGDPSFVIHMIVGDTQRVIEYPKLGHTIYQDVPPHIEAAMKRLMAAGFTQRQLVTQLLSR
jgi:uncharacterized SAM-binding protein YcdF (DUF218 family)